MENKRMENKHMENKRVNSTNIFAKECIVEALLKLIKTKPLSSISISELTKTAGVSRMTFYRNYESKEDIFIKRFNELLGNYEEDRKTIGETAHYYDKKNLKHCFEYFKQYMDFLNGMFACGFGNIFLSGMTDYIMKKWGDEDGKNKYELYSFSGALFNLYIGWTSSGCKESAEDMADILNNLYLDYVK